MDFFIVAGGEFRLGDDDLERREERGEG